MARKLAEYRGHCPDCDGTIQPGDPIVLSDELAWVHELCEQSGDPLDALAARTPVCPDCFIAHAGECW